MDVRAAIFDSGIGMKAAMMTMPPGATNHAAAALTQISVEPGFPKIVLGLEPETVRDVPYTDGFEQPDR